MCSDIIYDFEPYAVRFPLLAEIVLIGAFGNRYTLFVAEICNSIVIRLVSPTFKGTVAQQHFNKA